MVANIQAFLIFLPLVGGIASAQSPAPPCAPAATPQVQPALPQWRSPAAEKQNAATRERVKAERVQSQAQEQERQRLVQENLEHGYWIDSTTRLMWAAKDNGKAVTWRTANNYCRKRDLAGFSDWRLATLDELATLVGKTSPTREQLGNDETVSILVAARHTKGNLLITGDPWSSNRELDRFGHPYGAGWFFDFTTSKPSYDLQLFRNTKYALCVRRSNE